MYAKHIRRCSGWKGLGTDGTSLASAAQVDVICDGTLRKL